MATDADVFLPAINSLVVDIDKLDVEAAELKRTVNKLCVKAGLPPRYADTGPGGIGSGGGFRPGSLKSDQFYGKPQATAVREYMDMRGAPGSGGLGAASVRDIYLALKEGGFAFDTKNDANAMRGLRISLAKNSAVFHKLPNGQVGLRAWYPNAKSLRVHAAASGVEIDSEEDAVDADLEMPAADAEDIRRLTYSGEPRD
jgi:hypothetical protein